MAALPQSWTGQTFNPAVPLDIATLEGAILAQLKSAAAQDGNVLAKMRLEHFPDRPDAFRLTNAIGAVLVRYHGTTYGPNLDTFVVSQEKKLTFEIAVIARDLGWAYGGPGSGTAPGAYAIMEAVRLALIGFRIQGCSRMYIVREEFVSRDKQGGTWCYAIDFAFTTMSVEESSPEDAPEFNKGVILERGGITARQVAPVAYTFNGDDQIVLPYSNLSNVTVTSDPSGTSYQLGTDYSVDQVNGIITRMDTGSITAEATVLVGYSYAEQVIAISSGGGAPTAPSN